MALSYTMFINTTCIGQVLDSIPFTKIIVKDTTNTDSTKVKKNFFNSGATYNASDTVSIKGKPKAVAPFQQDAQKMMHHRAMRHH